MKTWYQVQSRWSSNQKWDMSLAREFSTERGAQGYINARVKENYDPAASYRIVRIKVVARIRPLYKKDKGVPRTSKPAIPNPPTKRMLAKRRRRQVGDHP